MNNERQISKRSNSSLIIHHLSLIVVFFESKLTAPSPKSSEMPSRKRITIEGFIIGGIEMVNVALKCSAKGFGGKRMLKNQIRKNCKKDFPKTKAVQLQMTERPILLPD